MLLHNTFLFGIILNAILDFTTKHQFFIAFEKLHFYFHFCNIICVLLILLLFELQLSDEVILDHVAHYISQPIWVFLIFLLEFDRLQLESADLVAEDGFSIFHITIQKILICVPLTAEGALDVFRDIQVLLRLCSQAAAESGKSLRLLLGPQHVAGELDGVDEVLKSLSSLKLIE